MESSVSFYNALQYVFCWRQYLQKLKELSSGKDRGSTSYVSSAYVRSHVRTLLNRYPILEKVHSANISGEYLDYIYADIDPSDAYRRCKESLKLDKKKEAINTLSPFIFLKMALSKKAHAEYIGDICWCAGSPEEVVHYLECATIRFPWIKNLVKSDIDKFQAIAEKEKEAERKAKEEYDKYKHECDDEWFYSKGTDDDIPYPEVE